MLTIYNLKRPRPYETIILGCQGIILLDYSSVIRPTLIPMLLNG